MPQTIAEKVLSRRNVTAGPTPAMSSTPISTG